MSEYILTIPYGTLDAAEQAFYDLFPGYLSPWTIAQARGATRDDARLYIQWEWITEDGTIAYRDAVIELGGHARETKRGIVRAIDPVAASEKLGAKRKPELYSLTTKYLVALALQLGITPTPQNREQLLDRLESHEEQP
jgi:hypothetical protein